MPETLNLAYHRQPLLLKALNRHRFKTLALRALGVSEKQGFNMIKYYEVKKGDKGYYSEKVIEFNNINKG